MYFCFIDQCYYVTSLIDTIVCLGNNQPIGKIFSEKNHIFSYFDKCVWFMIIVFQSCFNHFRLRIYQWNICFHHCHLNEMKNILKFLRIILSSQINEMYSQFHIIFNMKISSAGVGADAMIVILTKSY